MRRRNPPSRNRRRNGGPPPWPPAALIADCRAALIARRGLGPGAAPKAIAALRRAGAWLDGVDMIQAPDAAVVERVWAWATATDGD